jgi:hypothetical protein
MRNLVAWRATIAEFRHNLVPKCRPDAWVTGEEVKARIEQAGRRVASRKEDVEQVIPDDLGVVRLRRKGLEEYISSLVLVLVLVLLSLAASVL